MATVILGIDPGYGRLGWGVIQQHAQIWTFVAAGCFETGAKEDYTDRLEQVYDTVVDLLQVHKPSAAAVETLFFNTNTKTALLTSQARGVILLAAKKSQVPIFDYTPLQVKQALVGYGRGDKKQIQSMLTFHLKMTTLPKLDDACDALAIALTHAYTNQRLKS